MNLLPVKRDISERESGRRHDKNRETFLRKSPRARRLADRQPSPTSDEKKNRRHHEIRKTFLSEKVADGAVIC
jgi:hypothetical protein